MTMTSLRPYLAAAGVLLGAGIVSLEQRLLSVGLPDLRGALSLGIDEAAWIPSACDMALMFMGPLAVYLGAILGPRRVLLIAIPVFCLASSCIPFVSSYDAVIVLEVLVGLSAGTFYPLSLVVALTSLPPKYAIYTIGVFSMELLVSLSLATSLQAWFAEHWSYRWIFWAGPALALVMLLMVYVAVPNPPARPPTKTKPTFLPFLLASAGLSLMIGVLQQGERLDWLSSGTIIAMLASGGFLLVAALIRRLTSTNPLLNLNVLRDRNTLIAGLGGIFFVRFVLLSIAFLVPAYLGVVQGYRPLETGRVLMWSLVPLLLGGTLAARLMRRLDGRFVASVGILLVGLGALGDSRLTSVWVAEDFMVPQLLLGAGLAWTLVAVVGTITAQLRESGAIGPGGPVRPLDILTFASFAQAVRLFGGQAGATFLQRFVTQREFFHSNRLGYDLQVGDFAAEERLKPLLASVASAGSSIEDAQDRAVLLLGAQVRREAFTLAYADAFLLIAIVCVGFLLALIGMKRTKNYYAPLVDSPGGPST